MTHNESLEKAREILGGLNDLAEHGIRLSEAFAFPAYDERIRRFVESTGRGACYGVYMKAVYYELVMTVIRMFDPQEGDTVNFSNLLGILSEECIQALEADTGRSVGSKLREIKQKFEKLKGSHLVGRLRTTRNKMYAHLSISLERNQIAEYGFAEKVLETSLDLLNDLNSILLDKTAHVSDTRKFWRKSTMKFWEPFINAGTASTN